MNFDSIQMKHKITNLTPKVRSCTLKFLIHTFPHLNTQVVSFVAAFDCNIVHSYNPDNKASSYSVDQCAGALELPELQIDFEARAVEEIDSRGVGVESNWVAHREAF